MKRPFLIIILLLTVAETWSQSSASASNPKPVLVNAQAEGARQTTTFEYTGLLINRTRTRTGQAFYELFNQQWNAPQNAKNYMIVIEEVPGSGRSSQVAIWVNEEKLTTQALQDKTDYLKQLAGYLIPFIQQHILQNKQAGYELY